MTASAGSDRLAAGLASVLVAPARLVAPGAHLPADLVARLGKGPVGQRALNRRLAGVLGFDRLTLAPGFRDRLATSAGMRGACRLVLAPEGTAVGALRQLVGAINQVRVRAAILKIDRRMMEALLGAAVMQAALRPTPAMAALAGLADPALPVLRLGDDGAAPPLRDQPLFRQAVALAQALIAAEEPALVRLWQARNLAEAPVTPPPTPTPAQAEAAWRILSPGPVPAPEPRP
jgi:hypothetical protein